MPPTPDDIARARREALAPFCAAFSFAMAIIPPEMSVATYRET